MSRVELLRAIRLAASGQSLLDPHLAQQVRARLTSLATGDLQYQAPQGARAASDELTEREREVLTLVARGYTNKKIASTLFVSEKTARNHVSHILEKLGLERRSEAAAFAVEHKLVPPRALRKDDEPS
jgi:two-component system, NarL family, response regulator DevR